MRVQRSKRRFGGRLWRAGVERSGSVLVVVLWLMALLWVIGLFFVLFATTEQGAAQNYSDAAKVDNSCGVDPDVLWDWALRQIIVGPKFDEDNDNDPTAGNPDSESESSLYTFDSRSRFNLGRYSIIAHVLGNDLQAYNGQGINLITTAANPGMPFVDQDFDGVADADQSLLQYNYSSAAVRDVSENPIDVANEAVPPPTTDVGYTYPDINAIFLSARIPAGPGPNGILGDADDTPPVIIPSYHRPQYLRSTGAPVTPIVGWDTDANTSRRIFRPHELHATVDANGTSYTRYLQGGWSAGPDGAPGEVGVDDDMANGVDDPGELGFAGTDDVFSFPFASHATQPVELGPDGQYGVAGVDDDMANGVDDVGELGWPGSDDVVFREGIWTNDSGPNGIFDFSDYNYDADPDGDGINEGIYIPLAFPVQECGGKRFVPLFSITIREMDALLNANVAGNTEGTRLTGTLSPSVERFNQSNQALSPSELSLHYAINADPLSVLDTDPAWDAYKAMFGIDPTMINREVLANMETFFLLHGRGVYTQPMPGMYVFDSALPGRYGDIERLNNSASGLLLNVPPDPNPDLYPRAGAWGVDDDEDSSTIYGNAFSTDRTNANAFNHPLDILGLGRFVNDATGNGTLPNRPDLGTDPNRWVQYLDYDANLASYAFDDVFPTLLDWTAPNTESAVFNRDEGDEIVLLPGFPDESALDAAFGVEEIAALHKSDSDPDANLIPSRLRDLLRISFDEAGTSVGFLTASELRRQFTTVSWDRIEFALTRALNRQWESANNFPPQVPVAQLTGQQPFRQELIDLFQVDSSGVTDSNLIGLQRKLDINRHLVTNGGQLQFRELTTYDADPVQARLDRQQKARDIYVILYVLCGGRDAVDLVGPDGQFGIALVDDDGNGVTDDISEHLWPGSDDESYYSTNAGNQLYSNAQMKQMAQFAVNLVDALDADNVMTEFEYDEDLSNGWNLDDDPTTTGEPDSAARTVYGMEAQQLTFSEVVAIHADVSALTGDHNATRYNENDSNGDRRYVFVELRNASPFDVDLTDVDLSNSVPDPAWQIVYSPSYVTTDPAEENLENNLGMQEVIQIHPNAAAPATSRIVEAGGLYNIGTSGGHDYDAVNMEQRPSDFVVDWNLDGFADFDVIIPRPAAPVGTMLADPSNPTVDLDLAHPDHDGWGTTTDGTGSLAAGTANLLPLSTGGPGPSPEFNGKGAFLTTMDAASGTPLTLHLRRLADPSRPFNAVSNRWVIVDRIEFTPQAFTLNDGDAAPELTAAVNAVTSDERPQPLRRKLPTDPRHTAGDIAGAGTVGNSISTINETTTIQFPNGFTAWQPHFDRHYASIIELMSTPLYGPGDATASILLDDAGLNGQTIPQMGIQLPPLIDRVRRRIAQEMFLFPDYDGDPSTPATPAADNRWHRLFAFIEVPSKMHRDLGDVARVPGRINVNVLRHPGVFGGMIDDPLVHNLNLTALDLTDTVLDDTATPRTRNWWYEFIAARDAVALPNGNLVGTAGKDPVTNQYVPGVAGTRPFREFSHSDHGTRSIDHTLLRQLLGQVDPGPVWSTHNRDGRRLFEVGPGDDNAMTDSAVDYHMRHRLASKVVNHATTRSHVYAIFIAVDFFEVVDDTPGDGIDNPRIGAKLSTSPGHRGFFVIDVSDPLQAGAYTPPSAGARGRFDFKKYIIHRRTVN